MSEVAPAKQTRSMVRDLLNLLVDNHLLTDKECATILAIPERTVFILRKSDAFKAALAKMVEDKHGTAIRAVRNNILVAANTALETTIRVMGDPSALPSMKLEAAKLALEQHHKAEQRAIDMEAAKAPPPPPPNAGPSVNVTISVEDLSAARQAALNHGAAITLEPSESAHGIGLPGRRDMLRSIEGEGPPLRVEGPKGT